MHVLAGDIGGTHTRLRLARCEDGGCRTLRDQHFLSQEYAGLPEILREFLKNESQPIDTACLGVAGPVQQSAHGQSVQVTHLPWRLESAALARTLKIAQVRLINDFQAIGYGIEALNESDLVVLQPGEPVRHGPRAVIGAGTGLGQGLLVWQQDHYEAIATEGGHADFGPTDELQIDLARYLFRTAGQASYELILSGPGLVRLYLFLRARSEAPETPAVAAAMKSGDPAAAITQAALALNDPLANNTLDLFVSIYGAQAGNLALMAGATGGVYIAGGIAPKIISRLADGRFLRAFLNKGNMSSYVRTIPVQVIMNPEAGLAGAVQAARRL
jgi:glucokinase